MSNKTIGMSNIFYISYLKYWYTLVKLNKSLLVNMGKFLEKKYNNL